MVKFNTEIRFAEFWSLMPTYYRLKSRFKAVGPTSGLPSCHASDRRDARCTRSTCKSNAVELHDNVEFARKCAMCAPQQRAAGAAIWKMRVQQRVSKGNLLASRSFAIGSCIIYEECKTYAMRQSSRSSQTRCMVVEMVVGFGETPQRPFRSISFTLALRSRYPSRTTPRSCMKLLSLVTNDFAMTAEALVHVVSMSGSWC